MNGQAGIWRSYLKKDSESGDLYNQFWKGYLNKIAKLVRRLANFLQAWDQSIFQFLYIKF